MGNNRKTDLFSTGEMLSRAGIGYVMLEQDRFVSAFAGETLTEKVTLIKAGLVMFTFDKYGSLESVEAL